MPGPLRNSQGIAAGRRESGKDNRDQERRPGSSPGTPRPATHVYLRDADLAFTGNTITHVGKHYPGTRGRDDRRPRPDADAGPDRHPFAPQHRAVLSRHPRGTRRARDVHERPVRTLASRSGRTLEGRRAGKTVAYCEMLLTGITTVADLSGDDPGWIDLAAQSGLRVFLAPGYASARWHLENDWQPQIRLGRGGRPRGIARRPGVDRTGAAASLRAAVRHRVARRRSTPAREALLRESWEAAAAQNLPFTTHCAQSVNEFNEMVQAARQDADAVGARHRHSGAAHASSAMPSSPTSIPGCSGTPRMT